MRKLGESGTTNVPSPEVLSALRRCAIDEPLFPNLEAIRLWNVAGGFIPFIPLFLSPGTVTISIKAIENLPTIVASMITTIPTLCPNLRDISLDNLPGNPIISAAVSRMILASNRNTLRSLHVASPLTEEACEVVHKLPDLRELWVAIGRDVSLPPLVLPSLTRLVIIHEQNGDWMRMFHGATLGKLQVVTFFFDSGQIDGCLEAFERLALPASAHDTLSDFYFHTTWSWNPNYSSLLPFTQLTSLLIEFSCNDGCSSSVNDGVITNLARAMPKLERLQLGQAPCQTPSGATVKGLATLAHYCLRLSILRIHFQAASLDPLAIPGVASGGEPTTPRENCALADLEVGGIPVPEGSALMIALTLLRIFPRIDNIWHFGGGWGKVADSISRSKRLADVSSMKPSLYPEVNLMTPPPGPALESAI